MVQFKPMPEVEHDQTSTGSYPFDTLLHFLPLLAFYFYCYVLRFAVGEWIRDASPTGELWADEMEKQN